MAETTGIEWCDHTWSPWIGCTRISAACDHCYAADYGRRFGVPFETGAPRRRTSADYWKQPPRWNRQAGAAGRIATVFPSLCDPFDSEVDPAWLGETLALFEPLGSLRLLLLTKRPQLAAKYFAGRTVPRNVALGITAENQPMLELRGPHILQIKARWHFLSAEPLLGPLDGEKRVWLDCNIPEYGGAGKEWVRLLPCFDWIIAGGESGPKARPSHPDWFRALRDQCATAEVPFFFKQWGEYAPCEVARGPLSVITPDGEHLQRGRMLDRPDVSDAEIISRPGKKAAGATLDGREHREFPTWKVSA